jgi:hypothetical protein
MRTKVEESCPSKGKTSFILLVCKVVITHGSVTYVTSGVLRNFVWGGSTNSVEDRGQRERGSRDGSPLDRGSGGSCNLAQEISFLIVKFS